MIRYELKNFPSRRVGCYEESRRDAIIKITGIYTHTHIYNIIAGFFNKNVISDRAHDTDGRSSADSTESRWFLVSKKKGKSPGLSRGRGRPLKRSAAIPLDLRAHRHIFFSVFVHRTLHDAICII